MRKIIFDLTQTQPIGGSKYHGGGRYGEIVFLALVEGLKAVIGYYNKALYINPEILETCKKYDIRLVDSAETDILELCRKENGYIYSPLPNHRLASNLREGDLCVMTVHGLRVAEMPSDVYEYKYSQKTFQRLKYKYLNSLIAHKRKANAIARTCKTLANPNVRYIVVSEHTKASLLAFAPQLCDKDVDVCWSPLTLSEQVEGDPSVHGKYFLIVSGNRWLKNAYRAMQAFDELFTERPQLEGKVVVTGLKSDAKLISELRNRDRFVFPGYVDEKDLALLYKHAHLFVYPTLNEGFGYPPVEAMARNTPVIASAISSIPEVCGDAVMYFNPFSVDEIKMRILQMENDETRQAFVDKGTKRYKHIKQRQADDLEKVVQLLISYTQI